MRFSEGFSEQKVNGKGPYFTLVTFNSHDLTDKPEADGTLNFFTVRDIYIPFVY